MAGQPSARWAACASYLSLSGAVLVAGWLRAQPLLVNRFHPDEALYAYFARLIASGQDGLLASVVVDKPPLLFYLTAGSFALWGPSEFAARLPTLWASLASVVLLYALAHRLYDRRTAHLAAWLLALSPFAIQFSTTLFFDPLMLAFGLAALWAVVTRRYHGCGLALALAFATKQTALVYLPLVLVLAGLTLESHATPRAGLKRLGQVLGPVGLWLGLATLGMFGWDAVRHAPVGFWQQGYADNIPGRLVRASEIWIRALTWLDWLKYFTATPALNGLFCLGLPLVMWRAWRRPARAASADLLCGGYLLGYLAVYWLLAFNVWDRYLLPVLPLALLLLARVVVLAGEGVLSAGRWLMGLWQPGLAGRWPAWSVLAPAWVVVGCLAPAALGAAHSGYPVGGDHGAYDGIDTAARFVRTLPEGGVLYDHWLGWELKFYLFDGPVYVAWFPSPEGLTTDLLSFGRASPRYLIAPTWEAEVEIQAAVTRAGFGMQVIHTSYRRDGTASFRVYQLLPVEP